MTVKTLARALSAAVLATVLTGTGSAAAAPYTAKFRGEGSSSFGFAWDYARWQAEKQAMDDGFANPAKQCKEIYAFGDIYDAVVVWECTR